MLSLNNRQQPLGSGPIGPCGPTGSCGPIVWLVFTQVEITGGKIWSPLHNMAFCYMVLRTYTRSSSSVFPLSESVNDPTTSLAPIGTRVPIIGKREGLNNTNRHMPQ